MTPTTESFKDKNDGVLSEPVSHAISVQTAKTCLWVASWYSTSTFSNTIAKNLLSSYGLNPLTVTVVDSSPAILLVPWKDKRAIAVAQRIWKECFLIGSLALVAALLHRVALQWCHVSTVHTVKATQPLFSAVLSLMILGEHVSLKMTLALAVIVMGVLLGTFKPAAAPDRPGYVDALELNAGFGMGIAIVGTCVTALNSILTKRIFNDNDGLNHSHLFAVTRSFAFIIVFPLWLIVDVPTLKWEVLLSMETLPLLVVYAALQIGQHVSSLGVLYTVSPISHSVLNGFKRIFVICASMSYFGNRMSPLNLVGVAVSSAGVVWYSQVKRESRGLGYSSLTKTEAKKMEDMIMSEDEDEV